MISRSAWGARCCVVVALSTCVGAPPAWAGGAEAIDFAALGRAYATAHCPEGSAPPDCTLEEVMRERHACARLGVFDLHYPLDLLGEKDRVQQFAEIATALLDLQDVWTGWLIADEATLAGASEDLQRMRGWVAGWRPATLGRLEAAAAQDLLTATEASDDVRAAADRLEALLHDPDTMALVPYYEEHPQVRVLATPTRRDFMELVGFAGLANPNDQQTYWIEGVDQWTQFWIDWTFVLALEYAPWDFVPDFSRGLAMDKFEKTGLSEHVVQRATDALLRYCLPQREPGRFEQALTLLAAIDACGQVNTIDGPGARGMSGATTAPYSRFVPGGSSAGGILPPISAAPFNMLTENPWRRGAGEDYFVAPLRKGQKAGAKEVAKDRKDPRARDKVAHFLLQSSEGSGDHLVSAPFLGPYADQAEYPPHDFLIDYREFFRSYKTAFFHWLRTHGAESPELSEQHYQSLIRQLPEIPPGEDVDEVVEELYGLPLSARDSTTDSLEWRFLTWLKDGD